MDSMGASRTTRRQFLAQFAAVPIVTGLGVNARSKAPRPPMTVYKTPTCSCCKKWVEHVEKAGFKVTVRDMADVSSVRRDVGVPARLASCHTAIVGAYVIEGHVPADLIDKLLADKTPGKGLTIPGMPQSAPGMDFPGEPYEVLLFTTDGKTRVYARR
jgi:hypothetical protein